MSADWGSNKLVRGVRGISLLGLQVDGMALERLGERGRGGGGGTRRKTPMSDGTKIPQGRKREKKVGGFQVVSTDQSVVGAQKRR